MATKEKQPFEVLPSDTKVELVAIEKKTNIVFKKIIALHEFKTIKKSKNFYYYLFQIGYSQYHATN